MVFDSLKHWRSASLHFLIVTVQGQKPLRKSFTARIRYMARFYLKHALFLRVRDSQTPTIRLRLLAMKGPIIHEEYNNEYISNQNNATIFQK